MQNDNANLHSFEETKSNSFNNNNCKNASHANKLKKLLHNVGQFRNSFNKIKNVNTIRAAVQLVVPKKALV